MRQLLDEHHVIGQPPLHHLAFVELEQFLARDRSTRLFHRDHQRSFVPFRVGDADHRRFRYRGMRDRDVLQIDRADPFAARLDHVLGAIGDLHVAVGIERGHIAGGEPAVSQSPAFALEIAARDPGPAHHQVTKGTAIARQFPAFAVHDLHVDAEDRPPLLEQELFLVIRTHARVLGLERGKTAERAHFGHAPRMDAAHAVAVAELAQHRWRAGGTANHDTVEARELQLVLTHVGKQAEPDRGHALRHRDLFRLEEFVDALSVQLRAGQHELGAVHRGEIRRTPGIHMEHRHHRQDHVLRRGTAYIGQRRAERVQHGRAVGVEHALRIAGGARGVAQAGRSEFIEHRPGVVAGFGRQKFLIAKHAGNPGGGHVRSVGHRDPTLHRSAARRDLLDKREKREIKENQAVFGVVDDVDDLVFEQARVDGVDHRLHARNTVIELVVAIPVPGERADALARLDAEAPERLRQLFRADLRLGITVTVNPALDGARDDFRIGVKPRRVRNQRRDQQGLVHHETVKHFLSPCAAGVRNRRPRVPA